MPNHITNIVDFKDFPEEVFEKMKKEITGIDPETGEDWNFDFRKIIPPPEDDPIYYREDYESTRLDNNWYEWNRKNWGTKWNSYNYPTWKKKRIAFDTAWSMPFSVIAALSRKYPQYKIYVLFADEDWGRNCGRFTLLNGEEINSEHNFTGAGSYCKESRKFARSVYAKAERIKK